MRNFIVLFLLFFTSTLYAASGSSDIGNGDPGVASYATFANFPSIAVPGVLAVDRSADALYVYDAVTGWTAISGGGGGGVSSVTAAAPVHSSGGANPNITCDVASGVLAGCLSTASFNIFNNKEPAITAGTTLQYYRGDKTFQTLDTSVVPENGNLYYTNARFDARLATKSTTDLAEGANLYYTDARVLADPITGFVSGAGTVAATDTILQAIDKLDGNSVAGFATKWDLSGNALTGVEFFGSTNAQDVVFKANGSEVMRLDNANNNLIIAGSVFASKTVTDSGAEGGQFSASSHTTVNGSNATVGTTGAATGIVDVGAYNDKSVSGNVTTVTRGDGTDDGELDTLAGNINLMFLNSGAAGITDKGFGYASILFLQQGSLGTIYDYDAEVVPSGTGTITNHGAFHVANGFSTSTTNPWGLLVDDSSTENFVGRFAIGTASKKVTGANKLDVAGDVKIDGAIKSAADVNSVMVNNRELRDSSDVTRYSWANGILYDAAGIDAVDATNRQLKNSGGSIVFDWQNYLLNDAAVVNSINLNSRQLYNSSGGVLVSFSGPTLAVAAPLELTQGSPGTNPSVGADDLYFKADDKLYALDSAGTEVLIGPSPGGTGTVTSVGLSVPASSIFSVTNSPVTTSGTIDIATTGTSGGVPYFSSNSKLSSSAALASNQIVIGGGAGGAPASLGSTGTATTVLHGGPSNPSFGSVVLTTDVSGILPIATGGTNSSTALSNNRVMKSSGGAIVEAAAITANKALASDGNGIPVATATTGTELGFVSGVTSAIQTQLNAKQNRKLSVVDGGNAAYSISAADDHIRSSTTLTANRTYTLPACAAGNIGEPHEVKNLPAQTFNIILAANGAEVIDGNASYTLNPGDSIPVICAASGVWDIR